MGNGTMTKIKKQTKQKTKLTQILDTIKVISSIIKIKWIMGMRIMKDKLIISNIKMLTIKQNICS